MGKLDDVLTDRGVSAGLGDPVLDGLRGLFGRLVGEVHPALPALEARLVDQVEDVDELDVRIAREQVEHLLVPARLVALGGELTNDTAGAIGAGLAAICCATPILAVVLGGVGLSAWLAKADYIVLPVLLLGIARRPPQERWRDAAGVALACVAGVLVWAVPLVLLTGGPAEYWRVVFNQGAEDLSGVVMLWTTPTVRQLLSAFQSAFVAPWGLIPIAVVVLPFAVVGLVDMARGARPALTTLD